MKRFVSIHAQVAVFFLFQPAYAKAQSDMAGVVHAPDAADLPGSEADFAPDDTGIPGEMLDLMRISQLRYQEGAKLLQAGDSVKARASYNAAVDMILRSEWDLTVHSQLNLYFQELIERIRRDESRYLTPLEQTGEEPETAVVDELERIDLIPITIDPALQENVESDLANASFDIPVVLNETVLKSLNYWLGKGLRYFSDGLVRSGRYRDMIQRIFREESIPLDVMYLAQVESLFKTNALSRMQAKGIWQFGRATAIRYGLRVDSYIDERSDPEKSTRAAARYLNDLYAMFGDWNLVLAAYNWGEGRVLRLINRSGLNDFWDLLDLRRNFPKETKNHVPLIMASIILARNPDKYGLPTELEPPLAFDRVAVPRPIDLRAAAKVLDVPVSHLKELNPELRGYATPPRYPGYELKVPAGTNQDLAEELAGLPEVRFRPEAPLDKGRYRVRPGDTLYEIARRYRVSVAALQQVNGIRSPKSLQPGTILKIPSGSGKSIASAKSKPGPSTGPAQRTQAPQAASR